MKGFGFGIVSLIVLTFAVTVRLGIKTVELREWPVLRLIDTVDYPGAFIERQDMLILGIVVLTVLGLVVFAMIVAQIKNRIKEYKVNPKETIKSIKRLLFVKNLNNHQW